MLPSKKRECIEAKSYSKGKPKKIAGTMEQSSQQQLQLPLMGALSTPALNYQAHLVGSQTISRSSNLHKQFYAQAQAAANRCSIYQQPVPPTGYLYYDQPTSGYQVPHHQFYGPPGQPHTLHRYSYAPMSLALRAPRDRSSIPVPMMQQPAYQQTMQPNGGGKQSELEEPKKTASLIYQEPTVNLIRTFEHQARLNKPLCRCRVMYLGSSVPHITKNGLHGIQEPLRHLYPEEQFNSANLHHSQKMVPASSDSSSSNPATSQTIDISHLSSSLGIDSWLSVWSNGLLLENVDEFGRDVRRFYSIESLHYCAAVRFFDTTTLMQATNQTSTNNFSDQLHEADANNNQQSSTDKQQGSTAAQLEASRRGVVRFLPLDAPIFQYPGMMDANHPPVFAAIMRRTSGIKVLECHAFICRRDAASNALVRCCTHAYSDFLSAKRLSADFGFLQQQQASAYMGQTTSSGIPLALDDELLARGQTMPSSQSRRFRSATGGRHAKSSRAPLDGGQYQVIEALINQSQQGTSNSSRKSGSQKRRSARHPPANSTGTNSNELTHSESLNSADESEPEDNYAIIPKSNSTLNNSATASHKVGPSQHHAGRDRSSRRRSRTIKGSSKSLFKDFMPRPLELSRQSAHELDIEKLSHSLDYLAMMSSQQQVASNPDRTKRGATSTQKSDYHEPSREFGVQSDIMYSIVSTKNRRHSKSMQNLVQQQHQRQPHQPYAASLNEARSRKATGRTSSSDRKGSLSRAHRKSASLQDILAQELPHQLRAPPVPPSPSSFASLSRRSSLRSSLGSRSRRSRLSSSNLHINQDGSQHYQEARQRKSSFVSSTEGNSGRIYAVCDNSIQRQENARVLGPDCCSSKARSRSHSRAGSSKRSRSKRRESELSSLGHAVSMDPHQEMNGYNQLASVHMQSLYNPLLSSPVPQQPVYMPPTSFYGQPGGAPLYSSNSIYDTVTPPPAPFMPLPYVHSQYHHPHQQLFFPQAVPLSQQHLFNPPANYSMPAVEPMATSTKGKSKSKSATLATRFRCLSPPLSFFSSTANQAEAQQHQQIDSSQPTQNGQDRLQMKATSMQEGEQISGRREPLASPGESLDEQKVCSHGGDIVSGQPGFMTNQSGEPAGMPEACPTSRKQKLSWIKRLSITLSAGGSTSQASGRALNAANQMGQRGPQASGFGQAPVKLAGCADQPEAESEATRFSTSSGQQPDSVAENSRLDELERGLDGQSLPDQQRKWQPSESGSHQVDGSARQEQQLGKQEAVGEKKKTKRKRTGLFSGALTLGRSTGQKEVRAAKILT